MAAAMPIAAYPKGWHSTAAIWVGIFNLPGIIPGIWAGTLAGDSVFLTFLVTALANWAFYFWTIKGVMFLKHKLPKKRGFVPPSQLPA